MHKVPTEKFCIKLFFVEGATYNLDSFTFLLCCNIYLSRQFVCSLFKCFEVYREEGSGRGELGIGGDLGGGCDVTVCL